MKRAILLALFVFVASSLAFGQKKRTSKNPRVSQPKKETNSLTAVNKEAITESTKHLRTFFTECGDSYYAEASVSSSTNAPTQWFIVQCKNFSTRLTSYNLLEADTLNGFEWKGVVYGSSATGRTYYTKGWSEWGSFIESCQMSFAGIKRNSLWEFGEAKYKRASFAPLSEFGKYRKISCSDVPE